MASVVCKGISTLNLSAGRENGTIVLVSELFAITSMAEDTFRFPFSTHSRTHTEESTN